MNKPRKTPAKRSNTGHSDAKHLNIQKTARAAIKQCTNHSSPQPVQAIAVAIDLPANQGPNPSLPANQGPKPVYISLIDDDCPTPTPTVIDQLTDQVKAGTVHTMQLLSYANLSCGITREIKNSVLEVVKSRVSVRSYDVCNHLCGLPSIYLQKIIYSALMELHTERLVIKKYSAEQDCFTWSLYPYEEFDSVAEHGYMPNITKVKNQIISILKKYCAYDHGRAIATNDLLCLCLFNQPYAAKYSKCCELHQKYFVSVLRSLHDKEQIIVSTVNPQGITYWMAINLENSFRFLNEII